MDQIPEAEARDRELAQIDAHLAAHGATRCPPAFAGVVTAAVGPQEEQRRLAQLKLLEVKKKSAAWPTGADGDRDASMAG